MTLAIRGSILLLLLAAFAAPGHASSIARVGSSELVEKAELIFQGEVVYRESWQAPNGFIFTTVEFHVQEVIKGTDPGPGLRLRFNGGSVAGTSLSTGVAIPSTGEHGIYFVRSLNIALANPLVGWTQGHFTIHEDNSVRAGNGDLVTDVQPASMRATIEISEGIPRGFSAISRERAGVAPIRGLTPEEFKYQIRELWENGPVVRREIAPAQRIEQREERDPGLWARETP